MRTTGPADAFAAALRSLVDDGWTFNGLLVWDKAPYGGFGIGSTWRTAHEPIIRLSKGPPRRLPARGCYPSILRQRPRHTRTGKPWELIKVLIEASTVEGDLVVDPYCGLDPLQQAAKATNRQWLTNDILPPEEVLVQARSR